MGSPRVTSRPSAPRGGGGTGGGTTGGGTTSVSGYDRYIGTLGAIADAPTGSNFANYLTLPAAEKYDWIRVVTTSTINGVNFLKGQEWICSAKTAKDLPVNWEERRRVPIRVHTVNRYGDFTSDRIIESDTSTFIFLRTRKEFGEGIVAQNKDRTVLTNMTEMIAESDYIDITMYAEFAMDITGDRGVGFAMYSYAPNETAYFGDFIDFFPIAQKSTPSAKTDVTSIELTRYTFVAPKVYTSDGNLANRGLALYCFQSSGQPLKLTYAALELRGWVNGG
jgi:hypothetical protein